MSSKVPQKLIIGLIIGSLIGGLGGFYFSNSSLQTINDRLETSETQLTAVMTELEQTRKEFDDLEEDFTEVTSEMENLLSNQVDCDSIIQEYEELQYSYEKIQETYNLFSVSNNSRKIHFTMNLTNAIEVHDEWDFDVGYGVIMKVRMWAKRGPGHTQTIIGHTWIRGDLQGNLGGGSTGYTTLPDVLEGYAYCNIYDDGAFFQAEIGVVPLQGSWEGSDRWGTFDKIED